MLHRGGTREIGDLQIVVFSRPRVPGFSTPPMSTQEMKVSPPRLGCQKHEISRSPTSPVPPQCNVILQRYIHDCNDRRDILDNSRDH